MTAMSALCQTATWQLDRDRSSYRPRSDIHRRTYQTSCAPRDDLVSRLRGVELSGNSSMISRARARAGARKGASDRVSFFARLKETGFRLLVFRWVPLLRVC